MGIFLALLHHPVLTRHGDVGTTAVTNVDIHDLARTGRTYGVETLFLVTPIELQRELVGRILRHWTVGSGGRRNATRAEALARCEVVPALDDAIRRVTEVAGERPKVVVTGAGLREGTTPFSELRRRLAAPSSSPHLVLFGTGYGLAPDVISGADVLLPAIDGPQGPGGYNHLPVRSAVAIILDRLLGSV